MIHMHKPMAKNKYRDKQLKKTKNKKDTDVNTSAIMRHSQKNTSLQPPTHPVKHIYTERAEV